MSRMLYISTAAPAIAFFRSHTVRIDDYYNKDNKEYNIIPNDMILINNTYNDLM